MFNNFRVLNAPFLYNRVPCYKKGMVLLDKYKIYYVSIKLDKTYMNQPKYFTAGTFRSIQVTNNIYLYVFQSKSNAYCSQMPISKILCLCLGKSAKTPWES